MRLSSPKEKDLPEASVATVWRPPTATEAIGPAPSGNCTRTGVVTSTRLRSSNAPMGPFCLGGCTPHWPHWLPPTQKSSPLKVTKAPCSSPTPICFTPPRPARPPSQPPGCGSPGTARACSRRGACAAAAAAMERVRSTSRMSSTKKVCPCLVSRKSFEDEHCTSTKLWPFASPCMSAATGPTKVVSAMPSPQTNNWPWPSRAAPKLGPKAIFAQPGLWPSNHSIRRGQSTSSSAPPGTAWERPQT
mmetsp:Transcript_13619/g.42102  ORF Transcript_13619/g.42102 Transcript_13619/m.42102 type:complete len:246 (+) Transcript_13619:785-1522(+)